MSEPAARRDLEKTIAGLVDVVRILANALGHTNGALAKLATGKGLTDEDARSFDAIDDAL